MAKPNYINLKGRITSALRKIWRYYDPGRAEAVARFSGVCEKCLGPLEKKEMQIDHPAPVVHVQESMRNKTVFEVDWNKYIKRLYISGYQYKILCKPCHREKSLRENDERRRAASKAK